MSPQKFFSYFDERERFEKGKCGCWVGNMGTDDEAQITALRTANTHNMGANLYPHHMTSEAILETPLEFAILV